MPSAHEPRWLAQPESGDPAPPPPVASPPANVPAEAAAPPPSPRPQLRQQLANYILQELAAVPQRRLDPDTPLFETLLDSTSVLALVSYLEQQYGIEIRDSEIVPANFSSLRQLVAYLERKTERASTPLAASA